MNEDPDLYVCNDCGEEFRDDGSMMCPNCGRGDLIEAHIFYEEMEDE